MKWRYPYSKFCSQYIADGFIIDESVFDSTYVLINFLALMNRYDFLPSLQITIEMSLLCGFILIYSYYFP